MTGNTIGRLAERAGVGVETVRFYQRRGLIEEPPTPAKGFREYPEETEEPPTPAKGFREYPEETVDRILFIRGAKDLGFTLAEIGRLLELKVDPGKNCASVKTYALGKIALIDQKLRSLDGMRKQLARLTEACDNGKRTSDCAILEALQ